MQAAVQEALTLLIHPPRPRVRRFVSPALLQLLYHWAVLAAGHAESGTYRVGLACLAADQPGQELLHTEFLSCGSARRSRLPQMWPGHDVSALPVMCQSQACRAAPSQSAKKKERPKTLAPPRWSRLGILPSCERMGRVLLYTTPSESHRSSRAGHDRTVRIQLSLQYNAQRQPNASNRRDYTVASHFPVSTN